MKGDSLTFHMSYSTVFEAETSICLSVSGDMKLTGFTVGSDKNLECVQFVTEGIEIPVVE